MLLGLDTNNEKMQRVKRNLASAIITSEFSGMGTAEVAMEMAARGVCGSRLQRVVPNLQ